MPITMRGKAMRHRNSFASVLVTGLLAIGCLGLAPAANAAPLAPSVLKHGESANKNVIRVKRRGSRAPRIPQPRGPGMVYFDYPYYYSRGHYPTHIVRYVYDPPYFSRARYRARCKGNRRCVTHRAYSRGSETPRRQRARRNR